jgi:hypothetical protein
MPSLLLAAGIIGAGVLLALLGLIGVRRALPLDFLQAHHEVAGFLFGVIGVMYAVLLAFVVFVVWEQYEDAKVAATREANQIGDLCRLAQGFPVPLRQAIWRRARSYAGLVVGEEWEAMARGEMSPRAQGTMDDLWRLYATIEPRTPGQSAIYAESLARLGQLSDDRRLRLHAGRDAIPRVLWMLLWFGGLITVPFTYFFGVRSFRSQALMTAALTGMIAAILFLIAALDHPFRGDARVTPDAFQFILKRMEEMQKSQAGGAPPAP